LLNYLKKKLNNKALFLDRDGVINFDYGYVYRKEDFKFRPEIFNICKSALKKNFKIIIITNQSGIGQNLFSERDFKLLNEYMLSKFRDNEIEVTHIYFCPYHPTKGKGKYLANSYLRKPNPGMFFEAAKDYSINLSKSIMIGDNRIDYEAAINANIKYFIDATRKNWEKNSIKIINNSKDI
tara:strand:- start:29 stop:571 length:543 start_codon:yes stop_codon:yes gene_type:complete